MVNHTKDRNRVVPHCGHGLQLRNSMTPFLGESCLGNRNTNMAHLNSICEAAPLTRTLQNLNITVSADGENWCVSLSVYVSSRSQGRINS